MIEINKKLARNAKSELDDTIKIKSALTVLGHYDDSKTGLSPFADDDLFVAINDFQKEHKLKVDGVINPKGETETTINKKLKQDKKAGNAFQAFWKNYWDMREADTIDADKYFHCKTNYEATEGGWEGTAKTISNTREAVDLLTDSPKAGLKETVKDITRDQVANKYGRDAAKSGRFQSSRHACSILRPKGLNEKY